MGWGLAGMLAVSACFGGGVGLGWLLTEEDRLALLTGFAMAALGALAYLVMMLEHFSADSGRHMANEDAIAGLSERVDRLEQQLATLAGRLEQQCRPATDELSAELQLLRSTVERLAGALPDTDDRGSPPDARASMVALLQSALQESRVDLYLQPIVQLPERRVVHYEAFSRLRDMRGNIISPADYISDAERSGLVSALDNLLLFRCINLVRKLGPRRPGVRLFINISGRALEDERFLAGLVTFISSHRELAQRVVLEASARDMAGLSAGSREMLARLARLGCAYSIDHVTDLFALDPAWLAAFNVQFVKIDAPVLLNAPCPMDRAAYCARLGAQKVTLIATRVEDEATVAQVAALGLQQAQGFLFGEPRPARADLNASVRRSA